MCNISSESMKEFLKTDEPYAFIIEDDCDFAVQ